MIEHSSRSEIDHLENRRTYTICTCYNRQKRKLSGSPSAPSTAPWLVPPGELARTQAGPSSFQPESIASRLGGSLLFEAFQSGVLDSFPITFQLNKGETMPWQNRGRHPQVPQLLVSWWRPSTNKWLCTKNWNTDRFPKTRLEPQVATFVHWNPTQRFQVPPKDGAKGGSFGTSLGTKGPSGPPINFLAFGAFGVPGSHLQRRFRSPNLEPERRKNNPEFFRGDAWLANKKHAWLASCDRSLP